MKTDTPRHTVSSFEDLAVFKKAYVVSLEIHKQSLDFPGNEQTRGLADQMRRASKGICANLAEGFGKQPVSTAEFKRYILMAMGSGDEMRVWLRYALDIHYIEHSTWKRWKSDYQEIAKMLNGLHKSWS